MNITYKYPVLDPSGIGWVVTVNGDTVKVQNTLDLSLTYVMSDEDEAVEAVESGSIEEWENDHV